MIYYINFSGKLGTDLGTYYWFTYMMATGKFHHWNYQNGKNLNRLKAGDLLILYCSKIDSEPGGFLGIVKVLADISANPDAYFLPADEHLRVQKDIYMEENPGSSPPEDFTIKWVKNTMTDPDKALWSIPVDFLYIVDSLGSRITKDMLGISGSIHMAGSGLKRPSFLAPTFVENLTAMFEPTFSTPAT